MFFGGGVLPRYIVKKGYSPERKKKRGYSGDICRFKNEAFTSVAFSPNGKFVALESGVGTIKLWEIATGQCHQILENHSMVSSVAFSPDGKYVASTSYDKTLKLWKAPKPGDMITGQSGQMPLHINGPISSVTLSSDRRFVASSHKNGIFNLWDVAERKCCPIFTCRQHQLALHAFSPNSEFIMWASTSSGFGLLRIATNQSYNDRDFGRFCTSIAFSPDSNSIASGYEDGTIRLWKVPNSGDKEIGNCVKMPKPHKDSVRTIIFSLDGKIVASASSRGLQFWEVTKDKCSVITIYDCSKEALAFDRPIALSRDGKFVASGSFDGAVRLYHMATRKDNSHKRGVDLTYNHGVISIAFSPDCRRVTSAYKDGTVKLWNMETYQCSHSFNTGRHDYHLSFNTTGDSLHTASGTIHVKSNPVNMISLEQPEYTGYNISSDSVWIMWKSRKLLWLPQEYRPSHSAVAGSTVVLCCRSGRVLIFKFSANLSQFLMKGYYGFSEGGIVTLH